VSDKQQKPFTTKRQIEMNIKYLVQLTTALLLCIATASVFATEKSQREQVETLFRLTQMENKIQESVDSVVQLQIRQNPQLAPHEKTIHDFFTRQIGWDALKDDIAEMYMKTFTKNELEQINAFYSSPAGQKVITMLPQLVQQRNQLAMQRIQQNIGELQELLRSQETAP
jgi:hypothetical protein